MNRRQFIEGGAVVAVATILAGAPEWTRKAEAAGLLPFEQGKRQIFPRLKFRGELVTQDIDIGTLGPDVDTVVRMDFLGDLPTGALVVSRPTNGQVLETTVVFLKRADFDYIQIRDAIGGDMFDMHKVSEWGIDAPALDARARLHAKNTAHTHQKVVYLGDLGLFQKQWGIGEKQLLTRIIRAQRPGNSAIGIQESNFSFPRL